MTSLLDRQLRTDIYITVHFTKQTDVKTGTKYSHRVHIKENMISILIQINLAQTHTFRYASLFFYAMKAVRDSRGIVLLWF
jgi:hypothetical protein